MRGRNVIEVLAYVQQPRKQTPHRTGSSNFKVYIVYTRICVPQTFKIINFVYKKIFIRREYIYFCYIFCEMCVTSHLGERAKLVETSREREREVCKSMFTAAIALRLPARSSANA